MRSRLYRPIRALSMPVAQPAIERQAASLPANSIAEASDGCRATLRALHLINGEHYAGAERVQDLLAGCLPAHGVDVTFACLKQGRFAALRQSQQTPLVELPMRSRFDLRPALRLASMVRRERFDVLHTHSARALLIARCAAALSGATIIHHVHGNTSSEVKGRRFTRLNAWAERRSLPAADAVIAVSQSVAAYLQSQGVDRKQIHQIPNGVPARACLSEKDPQPSQWTIGFIALLRPRKGLETFLDAAALARAGGLAARLRIVGRFETSDYEREIHARAERLGLADTIDWRGFQRQVDLELDAMDLLAFPSILPEGMPMVLLEAMAAGVPIVGTKVDGITDLLQDEENALLVSAGDPQELSAAIVRLLQDQPLRERVRQTAFYSQNERYSDNAMAAAVAQLYRTTILS